MILPDESAVETREEKPALFPGRSRLYVAEVARALGISTSEVFDLIVSGKLRACDVRWGTELTTDHIASGKSPRSCWRVITQSLTEFLAQRDSAPNP